MPVQPGDTFLLLGGPVPTPHLWVILWGPAGPAEAYLAVMLTTLRAHSDRTCVLQPGDHPFIQHDTVVSYRDVLRLTGEKLAERSAEGKAKPRDPVDAGVLERIRAGFFASSRTQHAWIEMAVTQFGARPPGSDR